MSGLIALQTTMVCAKETIDHSYAGKFRPVPPEEAIREALPPPHPAELLSDAPPEELQTVDQLVTE